MARVIIPGVTVTEDAMGKLLVPDELWALVEPILPGHAPSPKGGKPRTPDRVCLTGILFVLKTGLPWEDFPHEMGCCGMTLWNRLDEWRAAGVWDALHRLLLDKLRGADAIDFARVVVDSSHVRAAHGGKKPARAPSTAANAGASTTWPWTPTAPRWRRSSPRPTPTT
jgi:transposase